MKLVVVSDLHLGSPFCEGDLFLELARAVPGDAALILNGDTVDYHHRFGETDLKILDFLRNESKKRSIIWLRGNHDEKFVLDDPHDIVFQDSFSVDRKLFISHGHEFEGRSILNEKGKPMQDNAPVVDAAIKMAEIIASKGPLAVQMCKEAINEGLEIDQSKALELESTLFREIFATSDQKEGMGAFVEKREPDFKGE